MTPRDKYTNSLQRLTSMKDQEAELIEAIACQRNAVAARVKGIFVEEKTLCSPLQWTLEMQSNYPTFHCLGRTHSQFNVLRSLLTECPESFWLERAGMQAELFWSNSDIEIRYYGPERCLREFVKKYHMDVTFTYIDIISNEIEAARQRLKAAEELKAVLGGGEV